MKTIAAIITALTASLMIASRSARANDTEDQLQNGMKVNVEEVVTTLGLFQAFDRNGQEIGTNGAGLSREALLIKVARRMQKQAQELSAKAAAIELYLKLEQTTQPERQVNPELNDTLKNIAELKQEIEKAKAARATQSGNRTSAAVAVAKR
jgi:hypothetical protein